MMVPVFVGRNSSLEENITRLPQSHRVIERDRTKANVHRKRENLTQNES